MPGKGINGRANMQKFQMNSKKYGGNPFKYASLVSSVGRASKGGMWNSIQRRTAATTTAPAPSGATSLTANPSWNQIGGDIDGEAGGDLSGWSVSLSSDGTKLAIGAPKAATNERGRVRVYEYDATNGWVVLGGDIDGVTDGDWSGASISLSGDGSIIAIGAPETYGLQKGIVRIYESSGTGALTVWTNIGIIDGPGSSDEWGWEVSLSNDGSRIAFASSVASSQSGLVRVYERSTSTSSIWNQLGDELIGEAGGDLSGWSVSLNSDGSIVAISAVLNSDGSGFQTGHVRVYQYDATKIAAQPNQSLPNFGPIGWNRLGVDIDGEALSDYSGSAVSLSSDGLTVAIGAYGNADAGTNSGHVRVYELK